MSVNSLFVEKYRPSTLDLYISTDEMKQFVQGCIESNYIPHLLLHGGPGTGKTTLAKLLVNSLNCDYIYINASNERNIDTVRDSIISFASTNTFAPLKVIILDEADFLTPVSMAALRAVMEQFSAGTRFILTCNYLEKIIDPLISRCQVFKINPPKKADILKHICRNILDAEGIEYQIPDVAEIVSNHFPDIRKMINMCQSLILDGKIVPTKKSVIPDSVSNLVIDQLKSKNKDSWYEVRKIVANNHIKEFQGLYTDLFSRSSEYSNGNDAFVAVILNEYQKNNGLINVVDKELNFAACIAEILKTI